MRRFSPFAAVFRTVAGTFPKFLFNMAVFTWFSLLRIDESLGSKEWRGICRNQNFLDYDRNQVNVAVSAYKPNMEGAKCSRTHSCVCPPLEPRKTVDMDDPLCPFCAAVILCNMHVGPDNGPLCPAHDSKAAHKTAQPDKAPKSDSMLTYLRKWQAAVAAKYPIFGIEMKTDADRVLKD